jgi:quinol---cytochrome-c reductase cytochrome c subunit
LARRTVTTLGLGAIVAIVAVLALPAPAAGDGSASSLTAQGRQLYESGCQSCHGVDAVGVPDVAPALHGVGAAAADFMLSTGRMPLPAPDGEPLRRTPAYTPAEIAALVAYVGSLGGPGVPHISLAGTDLSRGMQAFMLDCAGCHQALGRGGVVTGASAPDLTSATPTQIAEAVRLGPYLMPAFSPGTIDNRALADIIGYVVWARSPSDPGGTALDHAGPVPEGMVAWFGGLFALVLVTRLIGKRWQP